MVSNRRSLFLFGGARRYVATPSSELKAIQQAQFKSPLPLSVLCYHRDMNTERALEFYKLTVEVQLAMYNGVIMAWREKVSRYLPKGW